MFATLSKIIRNVEINKRTMIDGRVERMCQKYIDEEFLILRYSKINETPRGLVIEERHQNELFELRKMKD